MVTLFLVLIVTLGFASTFFSRANLVLLILLPASEFLGFVDPMKIAVKGVFDIHALFAILIATATVLSVFRLNLLLRARMRVPILAFFVLWCYGVVYPWHMGYSSLFYSLKASKEFLTVFSFVAVLLFIKTQSEVDLAWKYLVGFGVYYSALEILGQLTGPSLQGVMTYLMGREDMFLTKIYLPFWPLILIALLYYFYQAFLKIGTPYLRLLVTFVGLLLTFFRSYVLATLVAVPLLLLLTGQGVFRTAKRVAVSAAALCAALVVFSFTLGDGMQTLNDTADKYLVAPLVELTTHTGGSLVGRERVSQARRKVLLENSMYGYGFIEKESTLGRILLRKVGGYNVGFIDKGTLDIPMKFGVLGYAMLISAVVCMIFILLGLAKSTDSKPFWARCMTMATVLTVSILVLPVHAPFTYSYSLLPFGIALGLIEKQRSLLEAEEAAAC